jgi:protein subunit release factor B
MGTQRFTSFNYPPLTKECNEKGCTVDSVDLPEIKRAHVAKVQLSKQAPIAYHTSERKEIVDFSVTFIPYDNAAGKKLLPFVKTAVEAVLKKDYNPDTATIQIKRGNKTEAEQTTTIDNCIVTAGEILVDVNDYVRIKFYLQGTLNAEY